jgi:hypothetical protein
MGMESSHRCALDLPHGMNGRASGYREEGEEERGSKAGRGRGSGGHRELGCRWRRAGGGSNVAGGGDRSHPPNPIYYPKLL